ncbi:protein LURP-one-related 11-like [Canna indica]|uniref:Protein LURP-one-related 11-like n=1 Tax=Canna indica TaxID=4628 RepID=A0AAQ3KWT5_9LILI|nr:protein LURP-one-related 11-like [Canna indica]
MAKIHPSPALPSQTPSSNQVSSSQREHFTIWMKSLVFNGNGCTVYDSKGCIAYRVDNYDSKRCSKVYLMDVNGKVVLKILKKKFRLFGRWEGYRCSDQIRPWFKVKRPCGFLDAEHPTCEVWTESGHLRFYQIDGLGSKSSFKIVDMSQRNVLAEVRRKHTESGIALGEDVFTMEVESCVDHSLIMGLVVVYGLMNHII